MEDENILLHVQQLAKNLISIPSTVDNPKALHEVLAVAKKELQDGFQIEEFLSNGITSLLISNSKRPNKQFKIIFNAHLDVVPAKQNQFLPFEKDGKLYGRGAFDMKATAAIMIALFKELAKEVNYPLGLQLVTDEEVGGHSGTNYQIEQGVKSEFVIAGENSNLKINNKAKGILWLKLTTHGKAAHGAYPWEGENALLKLQNVLNKVYILFPTPTKASWQTTINLAKIETSNTTYNKVPTDASAILDIRFIPEEANIVLKKIKDALPKDVLVEIIEKQSAQATSENEPYIIKLKKSIETISNKKGELVAMHGSSDIRFYEESGTAAICFGPVGSGQHSDEEWVDIKSLEIYYRILKDFLLSLK